MKRFNEETFYNYRFEKMIKYLQNDRVKILILMSILIIVVGCTAFFIATGEYIQLVRPLVSAIISFALISGDLDTHRGKVIFWTMAAFMPLIYAFWNLANANSINPHQFSIMCWGPTMISLAVRLPFRWMLISRSAQIVIVLYHWQLHSTVEDLQDRFLFTGSGFAQWFFLMLISYMLGR